uniref:Uncharacterized protein n=1 Tax=Parascaris equorum TaxID=6256 RepID=A0A914R932_PAREQ
MGISLWGLAKNVTDSVPVLRKVSVLDALCTVVVTSEWQATN